MRRSAIRILGGPPFQKPEKFLWLFHIRRKGQGWRGFHLLQIKNEALLSMECPLATNPIPIMVAPTK